MKKRSKRLFGALAALAAGAAGATLWARQRSPARAGKKSIYPEYNRGRADRWARPGMNVIFRAQLMPGRAHAERTFNVEEVLPSGRVTLEGFAGEHAETEFEGIR